MKNVGLVGFVSLCFSLPANAQLARFSRSSVPYQPIVNGQALPLTPGSGFGSPSDEGFVAVNLPFAFPFGAASFQTIYVHVNGLVLLTLPTNCNAALPTCSIGFPSSIPAGTFANVQTYIAAWWSNLELSVAVPGAQIVSQITSREASFEWQNVRPFTSGVPPIPQPQMSFKITLQASGDFSIHYGPSQGIAFASSLGGYQFAGTQGFATLGAMCSATTQNACCGALGGMTFCQLQPGLANNGYVPDTLVMVEPPLAPDLIAQSVRITGVETTPPANNVTASLSVRVQNFSLSPANNWSWRAYLSPDPFRDQPDGGPGLPDGGTRANDILLEPESGGNSLPPRGIQDFNAFVSTTSPPPPGEYYVIVQVDTENAVAEDSEVNNVAVLPYALSPGTDLATTSVIGVTSSGPDSRDPIRLQYFNRGVAAAGVVNYRVMLSLNRDAGFVVGADGGSLDALADGGEGAGPSGMIVLARGSKPVAGGETVDESVTVTMDPSLPDGQYFYVLQLDPAGRISEATKRNNVAFSTSTVTFRRVDLLLESVDIVDAVTKISTRTGLFGEPYRAVVRFRNQGGGTARDVRIGVILSSDSTLSLLSDIILAEPVIAEIPTGTSSTTIEIPFTLPLRDRADAGFATGNYFLFVSLDTLGVVVESNKGNNSSFIGPFRALAPAADYAVTSLQAPSAAGVGEAVPVFRTIRNLGNRIAPPTSYRYFASANTIVTTNDVPLSLQWSDGGTSLSGSLSLDVNGVSAATDVVKFPTSMEPGTYFVGCLVDPDNQLVELNKDNNALPSASVRVVSSSLRIIDAQLPDSTIGRPYFYRLTAVGESGRSTWNVENSQGELPAGLTLTADGALTGTPEVVAGAGNVRAFTVAVNNGGRRATARLVLRVFPSTATLGITTSSIPTLINSASAVFQYPLGAAGGIRPYAWRVAQGTLPSGVTLSVDGVLSGAPRVGTPDGTTRMTFEVRDSSGTAARRELALRLVAPGSLVLRTTRLPDAFVGTEYINDIAAENADGSALAKPLTWRVSGSLPPGVVAAEEGEVLTLSGKPNRAGTYLFGITIEDARGRTDSVDYTVNVYTNRLRVVVNGLPEIIRPTDAVSATFATQPATASTFRVVAGGLPSGLRLSPEGILEGRVEDLNASIGTFNFVVQAQDESGATGLAPFALTVERAPVRRMSCGSVVPEPLSGVLAAAVALVARRARYRMRRSRSSVSAVEAMSGVPAMVVLALALLPALSWAQSQYTAVGPTPLAFQPLPSTRTVVNPSAVAGARIPLPFSFRYFGNSYSEVSMSRYGYLALAGSDDAETFNEPVPHSSSFSPQTYIAAWWDSLVTATGSSGNFAYLVTGSSPNRIVAFEWRDVGTVSTDRSTFQILLFETSNQIRFSYGPVGPASGSASIGIQGSLGVGVPGLPCGARASCGSLEWPAAMMPGGLGNQAIQFFLPADLRVSRLAVDQIGYAGVRYPATAFVRNEGGRTATDVTVRFFLSDDPQLEMGQDRLLGDVVVSSIPVGEEITATFPGALPMTLSTGGYYVIAVVDPSNAVAELNDNNNVSPPVSMSVGLPKADLTVAQVTAPAMTMPGSVVTLERTISNFGNAPMAAFSVTYLLSDNNVISISDRPLLPVQTINGLGAGVSNGTAVMLTIPADLPGGSYWLGVCVNFDGAKPTQGFELDEISVVNNCAVAQASTVVSTGALMVLTTALPPATQYAPYGVRLQATGGSGNISWEVVGGSLPLGMSLLSEGLFTGAPARAGSFAFEVKATSGMATATQMLSLMVAPGSFGLTIVDQELPGAEFGRVFSAPLVAVGGRPPYRWSLKAGSELPDGLVLSEDGFIEGRPTESGDASFEVEVVDTESTKASRALRVRVVNPTALSIGNRSLDRGVIRQSYLQRLVAVGGRAPYQWAVTRFQQLPQNPTEAPGEVKSEFPENFGLAIQDGVNEDFLAGTPRQAGLFAVTLKVTDAAGVEETASLTLTVSYADGLAVTTTALPDAFVNQSYAVRLSHNGGREASVVFSLPCLRQAVRADQFECVTNDANQSLPAGLALGPDGSILGIPNAAPGVYAFLVKVADESGRQDVRGLSIRVQPDFATMQRSGGCASSAGSASLAFIVVLTLIRRRARQML